MSIFLYKFTYDSLILIFAISLPKNPDRVYPPMLTQYVQIPTWFPFILDFGFGREWRNFFTRLFPELSDIDRSTLNTMHLIVNRRILDTGV